MSIRKIIKIMILIVVLLFVIMAVFLIFQTRKTEQGRTEILEELSNTKYPKLESLGTVQGLSITPLIDFYSGNDNLKTEAGVAYLIKTEDVTILMDMGLNADQSHPSPLLQNMKQLNIRPDSIDMVFFSHLHLDHVGGMKEFQDKTFSLSQGDVNIRNAVVYSPEDLKPSGFNPIRKVEVITRPTIIHKGVASIGSIPRYLFIAGRIEEQSLIVNVQDKGLVLIVGCGHPTIERIIERVKMISDEPIYAIIGGLHFPISGGRLYIGPFNVQYLVGSDAPPWRGLDESDISSAIKAIKAVNPSIVALSPHDSSDWSMEQFKEAFHEKHMNLLVGNEIKL